MVDIANSSNLNSYTNPGVYCTNSASKTGTLTNRPFSGSAMVLRVFNPYDWKNGVKNCVQIAVSLSSPPNIYIRSCNGSTWSDWRIISTEAVTA